MRDTGSGGEGSWHFVVSEPLCGFIAHAAPWLKKAKKYVAYKSRVRLIANSAGVPGDIPEGNAAIVHMAVAWKKRARIDLDNLIKSTLDSLFKQDRGVEKIVCDRFEHSGKEEISVIVSFKGRGVGESTSKKSTIRGSLPKV